MSHVPRKLDKFWDERRHVRGLQPNGYIFAVWRTEGGVIEYVTVKFHDSKHSSEQYVDYYYTEIAGKYTNETMGWILCV